ncbi:hypothetical protein ACFX2A_026418 [Malus domestica]
MVMYSIINAENLKLLEPSMLDDDPDEDTRLPSVDDLRMEQEDALETTLSWSKRSMKQDIGRMGSSLRIFFPPNSPSSGSELLDYYNF